ncbi:MAG: cell division FtsZ family protein [Verrucomicrobia bacterium]|nr:cell division FtsZ family protein [Verrucomicrobiota bacterium]MCF7708302.1 cell division FtsZ family protein [Verrucomicrobiota bacterium]
MSFDNQENSKEKLGAGRAKMRVFGVGGAGCNIVDSLARIGLTGVEFYAVNTDACALEECNVPNKVLLASRVRRGLGAGGEPELGWAAAEKDSAELKKLFEGIDVAVISAGLGGGTGTGAAPVLARLAKESGALALCIAVLPFDCEGARRQRQAIMGLQQLKLVSDGVICLKNQRLVSVVDENTTLAATFDVSNKWIAECAYGVWRLLTRNGLMNVDFGDLYTVLQGRNTESFFSFAETHGPNRAEEIGERLLKNPLVENGGLFNDAEHALVSIAGGQGMTLLEVRRTVESIQAVAPNANIKVGAAIDKDLSDGLEVTVIASRRSAAPANENATPQTQEEMDKPDGFYSAPESFDPELLSRQTTNRPRPRVLPPPPELSEDRLNEFAQPKQHSRLLGRSQKQRTHQGQLPLEIVSKGRFEKSEPTIFRGEDLDLPTYIRKGALFN